MQTYLGISSIRTKSRLFILSAAFRRLSLREQTLVPQQVSCSEKQRLVPPSYCFSWPSSKATLNHPKLGHPKTFVLHQPLCCPPPSDSPWPAATEELLLQSLLLLAASLWIGNFTCVVSTLRSAWRGPWDLLKFAVKSKRKENTCLNI